MPRPVVHPAPLVAVVLLLAVCASSSNTAAKPLAANLVALPRPAPQPDDDHQAVWFEAAERKPAPDFTLPKVEGKERVALKSLRGKPVVLVFGSYS
jgi:cytochrome oxidase Cu insertion factor (SCO1/SenC/PrrC family)